jgi:hypothetical protein
MCVTIDPKVSPIISLSKFILGVEACGRCQGEGKGQSGKDFWEHVALQPSLLERCVGFSHAEGKKLLPGERE